MPRTKIKSFVDRFWNFVQENPEVAADLAFKLGVWAGGLIGGRVTLKRVAKIQHKLLDTMPRGMSDAALKLLPGPSPSPQPANASKKRRTRKKPQRKAA
jgi:hypothetical protein